LQPHILLRLAAARRLQDIAGAGENPLLLSGQLAVGADLKGCRLLSRRTGRDERYQPEKNGGRATAKRNRLAIVFGTGVFIHCLP
jgi:hypothetical protein